MRTPLAHRTKIVATLGPASASPEAVERLIRAGADLFRLNFSHGTADGHRRSIAVVRDAARRLDRHVALLQDLQGVKLRTTACRDGPFELATGAVVAVAGGAEPSTPERIFISPPEALADLEIGARILIEDGKLRLRAVAPAAPGWSCAVEVGGLLQDRKGVNLPDTPARSLPALTEKDRADLALGVREGIDLVALSFVRSAADVKLAREAIARLDADVPVIAKIEKPQALDDLEAILEHAHGVMVARGDLGVEMDPEKVPVAQKRIIAAARRAMKPVITATQMLESMIERPLPTRAEASDVANAVFDGTDAIMLSGETAVGKYPVESVAMAASIVAEAEAEMFRGRPPRAFRAAHTSFPAAIGEAAVVAAEAVGAKCIVVYTHAGYSALLIAGQRPRVPVYVFSRSDATLRRLALAWGIETRLFPEPPPSVEEMVDAAERILLGEGLVQRGDAAAIVAGVPFEVTGNTNVIKLHRVGEE